jgi:putative radical SAM enzyme (TIGR03279 family)
VPDLGTVSSAMDSSGGVVARIEPDSVGAQLGLEPGDRIVSINGHVLRDVIDYRFYGADEELDILVLRGDEEAVFEVERDYGVDLGIEFTEPTFDGIRTCANNCTFCFVKGVPKGMRRSLYVKDDDYRLAFLIGNFITLSNLGEADWARIAEQHLSPLYVSVHATDPNVHRRLLGNPHAPDILPQLRRLADLGIEVHTQLVLSPDLNDGPELARTIDDLAALWPAVRSVGIVPVGLTRFQGDCLRAYLPDEAGPLIERVERCQKEYRPRFGVRWVYASDEWYLLARRPVPGARAYDGFPQIENGIGLVRKLLDDAAGVRRRLKSSPRLVATESITLVCGALIAPVLGELAADLGELLGATIRALPVVNAFFGPRVTVSGLLTGQDVRRALEQAQPRGWVFLPRAMFNREGEVTLDDLTLEDIGRGLDARCTVAGRLSEVVEAIRSATSSA